MKGNNMKKRRRNSKEYVGFYLDPDLNRMIEDKADREIRSKSVVIRMIIDEYFKQNPTPDETEG